MATRRKFINTAGVLSGMLMTGNLMGQDNKRDKLINPLLKSRTKENSYWYIAHLMSVLVNSKDTAGKYALLRAIERKSFEPPPHTHTREDETFIILNGEATYFVGNEKFDAKEGDVVFLPKNIQHSFKIKSETLETLILLTPAGFENYFVEMSEPANEVTLPPVPQSPPDVKRIIATASKYGVTFSSQF